MSVLKEAILLGFCIAPVALAYHIGGDGIAIMTGGAMLPALCLTVKRWL